MHSMNNPKDFPTIQKYYFVDANEIKIAYFLKPCKKSNKKIWGKKCLYGQL